MLKKISAFIALFTLFSSPTLRAYDWGSDSIDCFWFDAEYIYWEIHNAPKLPPLVIDAKNQSNVLLGGRDEHDRWRSGGRFAFGVWPCDTFGVDINYFTLPSVNRPRNAFSNGSLFIPFFDTEARAESLILIGNAELKLTQSMESADINLLKTPRCWRESWVIFLAGFRYWNFVDNLTFNTTSRRRPVAVFDTSDRLTINNDFYGGQVGVVADVTYCQLFANLKAKFAVGAITRSSHIQGLLVTNNFNNFGPSVTFPGGIFALPSNLGRQNETQICYLPEGNINFGWRVTSCFRLQAGYTVLYVSNVLFAANQLDRRLNPSQSAAIRERADVALEGEAHPTKCHRTSHLLVHGISVGLELRF